MSAALASVDLQELQRAIETLIEPGAVLEVRALIGRNRVVAGYFRNDLEGRDALTQGVKVWSSQQRERDRVSGFYLTLNRIDPELLGRSCNHFTDGLSPTTADNNVMHRRWLLVDADAIRPAGVSSTDAQHEEALAVAHGIAAFLQERGVDCVTADSGNGGHVLIPVDLENSDAARALLEHVLKGLGHRFDAGRVHVDQVTFNASRICKLGGTMVRKGDSTAEQPHRMARLLHVPETLTPATMEQLQALAALAPTAVPAPAARGREPGRGTFEIDAFMAAHYPDVVPVPYKSGRKWQLPECPFDSQHKKPDVIVTEAGTGALGFTCSHNSCSGFKWSEFRERLEPESRNGRHDSPHLSGNCRVFTRQVSQAQNGSGVGTEKSKCRVSGGVMHENHEVEPFPLAALPEPLARMALEGAAALPCPPDFLAVPMLAICGAAIGRSRALEVKPGWKEGPRIWSAFVARPGEKKSPALALAQRPLERQQNRLLQEYEDELIVFQADRARYELEEAEWASGVKRAAKDGSQVPGERPSAPREPRMAQVFTTNSTVEALAELLHHNRRGIAFLRDELSGWVRSMDQYKGAKGSDLQDWLSFWSGAAVVVNRKLQKLPLYLTNPFVAVTGCLPPDVLGEFSDERGREDGFIHRILFSYPEPVPIRWSEAGVSAEAFDDYEKLLLVLANLQPDRDEEGREVPHGVEFTPEGRRAWVEWVDSHYREIEDPGLSAGLRGPWAKMDGYCASYALIIQQIRYVLGHADTEDVDESSLKSAAALIAYHKSHARRVYPMLRASEEDQQVSRAVQWIKKQADCTTTAREVVRNNVAGVRKASEAIQLFRELEDRGYGEITEKEKDSVHFTIL